MRTTKIKDVPYIIVNNEKYYNFKEISLKLGIKKPYYYKAYLNFDFLLTIKEPHDKKRTFISQEGVADLLKLIKQNNKKSQPKAKRLSLHEKVRIAREYGWSEGMVSSYEIMGILEQKIQEATNNGLKHTPKGYNVLPYNFTPFWSGI